MTETPPAENPTEKVDEQQAIEAIEGRLVAVHARLATLLQMIEDGRPLGGALVGRDGPWDPSAAKEFEALVKAHDEASGSLWDAISDAGFDVIELPEALYGALTPDTR